MKTEQKMKHDVYIIESSKRDVLKNRLSEAIYESDLEVYQVIGILKTLIRELSFFSKSEQVSRYKGFKLNAWGQVIKEDKGTGGKT